MIESSREMEAVIPGLRAASQSGKPTHTHVGVVSRGATGSEASLPRYDHGHT